MTTNLIFAFRSDRSHSTSAGSSLAGPNRDRGQDEAAKEKLSPRRIEIPVEVEAQSRCPTTPGPLSSNCPADGGVRAGSLETSGDCAKANKHLGYGDSNSGRSEGARRGKLNGPS